MNTSGTMTQALATFAEEARDLIAQMEEILLRAERGERDDEDLHALFRCAHTIKGSGGLFGLDEVVRFTHVVENVLDRLRNGEIAFDSELITFLLESQDHIAGLVDCSLGGAIEPAMMARSDVLLERLKVWAEAPPGAVAQAVVQAGETSSGSAGDVVGAGHWHLSLRFGPQVFADGMDPLNFIQYLRNYGTIRHLETVTAALPDFAAADPERCYLGFELALESGASQAEIEGVFEFVAETSVIRVLPPQSGEEPLRRHLASFGDGGAEAGDYLVACATLSQQALDRLRQAGQGAARQDAAGVVGAEDGTVRQRRFDERKASEAKSVKVPSDRLDALIDRVGELVIAGSGTHAQACKVDRPELLEQASLLLALVQDVREMTLRLRMVPIGEVFSRFPRVVRDVSKELGKQIELRITGADAELDKSMVEKLGDPLMHLLRNAMDHGVESAEARFAAGKPAQATVGLNAYHESGTIIVEVSDDGRGLDPEVILRKAVEKGLVPEGANLTESEIFRLILEPGFSTAEQVTNLSGRGVGMDVVKSSIEAMRGTLDIISRRGQGTAMRLCLPLTLAIIDGFHVGVGNAHFVVPLEMVDECVELPAGLDHVDYMELREEATPFVRLRELFGESGTAQPRPRVVVVRFAGRRIGLVVDRIYGKCQTVIKPLGPLFENVPCVSGSTILGGGEVALIIDVSQLVGSVVHREHRRLGKVAPKETVLA